MIFSSRESSLAPNRQTTNRLLQVTDHREDSYYAPLPTPLQGAGSEPVWHRPHLPGSSCAPPDFASKYKLTIIQWAEEILEMVASKLILQNGRLPCSWDKHLFTHPTFLCQVYIYIYLHLEHCAIVGLIIKLRTNGYFCDEVIVMLSSVWNLSAHTAMAQLNIINYRVGNSR